MQPAPRVLDAVRRLIDSFHRLFLFDFLFHRFFDVSAFTVIILFSLPIFSVCLLTHEKERVLIRHDGSLPGRDNVPINAGDQTHANTQRKQTTK